MQKINIGNIVAKTFLSLVICSGEREPLLITSPKTSSDLNEVILMLSVLLSR